LPPLFVLAELLCGGSVSDNPDFFGAAKFVRALLQATSPNAFAAHEAAQRAYSELDAQYEISREAIDGILFPPGEPSLLAQLKAVTTATIRRELIARLRAAADDNVEAFSTEESAQLATLADTFDSDTLSEADLRERITMLGLRSVPGPGWWDLTPDDDTGLSRHGIVGERCVAVYRYLAERLPPQRRQRLGQRGPTVTYNTHAMEYTATLISGAYSWYGLRRLSAADIAGHVSRRLH
jgi:hypothetical protein